MNYPELTKIREDLLNKRIIAQELRLDTMEIDNKIIEIENVLANNLSEEVDGSNDELEFLSELIVTSEELYFLLTENFQRDTRFYTEEDEVCRRESFKNHINPYLKEKNIIDYLFIKNIKDKNNVTDRIYGQDYKNCILSDDGITLNIFNVLISKIRENNQLSLSMIDLELKKKEKKILKWYDIFYYPNIVEWDFSLSIVKKLILEFGSTLSRKTKDEISYLFETNRVKISEEIESVYTISFFYEAPVVLMTDITKFDDLINLVHEIGHAIFHLRYPNKRNDLIRDESFAIYHELLFYNFLISKTEGEYQKQLFLKSHRIERVRGLVFRQNIETELELAIDDGEKNLEGKYLSLLEHYFGNKVEYDSFSKNEYLLNTHIFDPYYSYKYSLGCILAINIFLSHTPTNNRFDEVFLKKEDLKNDEYINQSFLQIENWINELYKEI